MSYSISLEKKLGDVWRLRGLVVKEVSLALVPALPPTCPMTGTKSQNLRRDKVGRDPGGIIWSNLNWAQLLAY